MIYKRFDRIQFDKIKLSCKKYKNKTIKYYNDFICLDTETSNNHKYNDDIQCWIYQWAFSFLGVMCYGRTLDDLTDKLVEINNMFQYDDEYVICYVHNLSYDIQYIKNSLMNKIGKDNIKILALKSHKILTFTIGHIEFRCSYLLSNKSLDKWSRDLQTKHNKKIGYVDYEVIRYPDSALTINDWRYMFNDVIVLRDALNKQMENDNDVIQTIPLTSTGYVRRDGRKLFNKNKKFRKQFIATRLNFNQYCIANRAFSGALTHGNRFYSSITINATKEKPIKHRDFTSHYPSQLRCKEFPIGKFRLYSNKAISVETLTDLINKNYACLIDCNIVNPILRDFKTTLPYLQSSKFKQGHIGKIEMIEDNGRILKATGISNMCLTELDYIILVKYYKFKIKINRVYVTEKGRIPQFLEQLIDKYFYEKSFYKEQIENEQYSNRDELEEMELNLMKSKNRLNGIYGMCATNIIRNEVEMNLEDGKWNETTLNDYTRYQIEEKLDKYYNSYTSFLSYVIGVYTTAWARFELMQLYDAITIHNTQPENFLYCDTDSYFYLSTEENEKLIEEYNTKWRKQAEQNHEYIETENKKTYYHNFGLENDSKGERYIKQFRFLHAKCYAIVTHDNQLKVTIAGVQQKGLDDVRIDEELGNIENLENGFVFTKCGGTRAIYVEENENTNCGVVICRVNKTLKNEMDLIDEDLFYQ